MPKKVIELVNEKGRLWEESISLYSHEGGEIYKSVTYTRIKHNRIICVSKFKNLLYPTNLINCLLMYRKNVSKTFKGCVAHIPY